MSSKRRLRRSACRGKEAHADESAAWAQVRQLVAAGKAGTWPMHAYRCPWCGAWHVGHVPHK